MLVESRLWLAAPIDFNDPFDMVVRYVIEGSELKLQGRIRRLVARHAQHLPKAERRRKRDSILRQERATMMNRANAIHDRTRHTTGVCSFAGDPKSILLWSHYARNHTGLCLQLATARDPPTFVEALAVDYSEEYPGVNWIEEVAPQLNSIVTRKYIGWAYEQERRIIIPDRARSYLDFHSAALTGVIFGCECDDTSRELVFAMLRERLALGMPPFRVFQATRHSSKFALAIGKAAAR